MKKYVVEDGGLLPAEPVAAVAVGLNTQRAHPTESDFQGSQLLAERQVIELQCGV